MGSYWPWIIAIGVPEILGSLVGSSTKDDVTVWFKALKNPSWTPPGPAFGIAWTILYGFMGYASLLVWQQGGWQAQAKPLTWYIVQLVLNLSWPLTFFKAKRLQLAGFVNLATLASAAVTTSLFYPVSKTAGQLMLPYLAWLAFANALNFAIIRMNDPSHGGLGTLNEDMRHAGDKANPGDSQYKPGSASACLRQPAGAARGRRLALSVACSAGKPRQAAPPARRHGPALASRRSAVRNVVAGRQQPGCALMGARP